MSHRIEDATREAERLVRLYRDVRRLRNGAFDTLVELGLSYAAGDLQENDPDGFLFADGPVEKALTIDALNLFLNGATHRDKHFEERLPTCIPDCRKARVFLLRSIIKGKQNGDVDETHDLPVFKTATTLQALAYSPGMAFSKLAIECYRQIVVELHECSFPDYRTGGARANRRSADSAFVTGICVQAVRSLARQIEQTAAFVNDVSKIVERFERIEALRSDQGQEDDIVGSIQKNVETWADAERSRLNVSLAVSLMSARSRTLMDLENVAAATDAQDWPDGEDATADGELLVGFIEGLRNGAVPANDLPKVLKALARHAKDLATLARDNAREVLRAAHAEVLSGTGGNLAQDANALLAQIEEAEKTAELKGLAANNGASIYSGLAAVMLVYRYTHEIWKAAQDLESSGRCKDSKKWRSLANTLQRASDSMMNRLKPTVSYFSSVLDRELLASGSTNPHCDAVELAYSVMGTGYMTRQWNGERLRRAVQQIGSSFTSNGELPQMKPIDMDKKGRSLHVVVPELVRALASYMRHGGEAVDEAMLADIVHYFHHNKVKRHANVGWRQSYSGESQPSWWMTALAAIALDRLARGIEKTINSSVLKHFSVRRPDEIKMTLDGLVYPDYGLASIRAHQESSAILGQKLRAHLIGSTDKSLPFSVVLHGPPGTMKTTFFEALAKTEDMPFVEITPSDILEGGVENMEMMARCVFKMLSMLTGVVIIFDEFDSILKKRTDDLRPEARNVFEFLTPGMLPKLRHLHDHARRQQVVYGLATNLIGTLDEAAIRVGRFDKRMGVYPPDAISRLGYIALKLTTIGSTPIWDDESQNTALRAMKLTSQSPIAVVGRMLGEDFKELQKLASGKDPKRPPELAPEKRFERQPYRPVASFAGPDRLGIVDHEWLEWGWCWELEQSAGLVMDDELYDGASEMSVLASMNAIRDWMKKKDVSTIQGAILRRLRNVVVVDGMEWHPRQSIVRFLQLIPKNGSLLLCFACGNTIDATLKHFDMYANVLTTDQGVLSLGLIRDVFKPSGSWVIVLKDSLALAETTKQFMAASPSR